MIQELWFWICHVDIVSLIDVHCIPFSISFTPIFHVPRRNKCTVNSKFSAGIYFYDFGKWCMQTETYKNKWKQHFFFVLGIPISFWIYSTHDYSGKTYIFLLFVVCDGCKVAFIIIVMFLVFFIIKTENKAYLLVTFLSVFDCTEDVIQNRSPFLHGVAVEALIQSAPDVHCEHEAENRII